MKAGEWKKSCRYFFLSSSSKLKSAMRGGTEKWPILSIKDKKAMSSNGILSEMLKFVFKYEPDYLLNASLTADVFPPA